MPRVGVGQVGKMGKAGTAGESGLWINRSLAGGEGQVPGKSDNPSFGAKEGAGI